MPVLVTEAEKQSPLFKYFEKDYSIPMSELIVMADKPLEEKDALRVQDINSLFKQGYLPGETGYCLFSDGTGTIANLTVMPKVTVEMIDWWFAWHGLEPLRYKIWDKNNHIHCLTRNPDIALNKNLSLRERLWNTTHDICETHIPGEEPGRVAIHFREPKDIGFDQEELKRFEGTIVCSGDEMAPVIMAHFVRPKDTGVEVRSRFWYGYSVRDGKPIPNCPPGFSVTTERLKNSLIHLINEFHNLSLILPEVYGEYNDLF